MAVSKGNSVRNDDLFRDTIVQLWQLNALHSRVTQVKIGQVDCCNSRYNAGYTGSEVEVFGRLNRVSVSGYIYTVGSAQCDF